MLATEVASRITQWKAARGAADKKLIEEQVRAIVRADEACGADAWGEGAVYGALHNFKA